MSSQLGNAITVGTYGNFDESNALGDTRSIGVYGWFAGDFIILDPVDIASTIAQALNITSSIAQAVNIDSTISGGG